VVSCTASFINQCRFVFGFLYSASHLLLTSLAHREPLCDFLGKPVPHVPFPGARDRPDGAEDTSWGLLLGYARLVFVGLAMVLATFLIGLFVGITVAGSESSLYDSYGYLLGMERHWCQQKLDMRSISG